MELEDICELGNLPYAQRAARVYRAFEPDLTDEQIARITDEAYGDNFDTPEVCPLAALPDDVYLLELWHGPTSAFKDMALQCLPRFFSVSAAELRPRSNGGGERGLRVARQG